MVFGFVKRYIAKKKRIRLWRKNNPNNSTFPANEFDQSLVDVGNYTYGDIQVYNWNNNSSLRIGSFCSIAGNVMFILNADHNINTVSTFPYKVILLENERYEAITKGDIIVDDDVWIGYGATILSGVHIGHGAVIAAGAVVSKDVESYSVVGGVPAKKIKDHFSEPVISFLTTLDYSKLTKELVESHLDELYTPLDALTLDEVEELYSWFHKKQIIV